jgi:hypothetical protein
VFVCCSTRITVFDMFFRFLTCALCFDRETGKKQQGLRPCLFL